MTTESEEAIVLRQIRQKADEAARLEKVYERRHDLAKEAKAEWEDAEDQLRELCRSWQTSSEVASRPLVKATEIANETLAALMSVGHTEDQALAAMESTAAKGPFASVNDWIEAIYAINSTESNGDPGESVTDAMATAWEPEPGISVEDYARSRSVAEPESKLSRRRKAKTTAEE